MIEPTLRHRDLLAGGDAYHVLRHQVPREAPEALHDHDFPELVWVESGRVRHHVNGALQPLSAGRLVFVRPPDRHGFEGLTRGAAIVTLMLRPQLLEDLPLRYPALGGRFFWDEQPVPAAHALDSGEAERLTAAAEALLTGPREQMRADALLLPLLARLSEPAPPAPEVAPDWLAEACRAVRDPAVFRDGAAGFVRVTGRTHAHVSRMARRHLGMTPSDYVNVLRMNFAARRLAESEAPLAAIAAECGIENLSHFHRLFKARHGTTPQLWRSRYRGGGAAPI